MKINVILIRFIEASSVFIIACLVNIQPVLAAYNYLGKVLSSVKTLVF